MIRNFKRKTGLAVLLLSGAASAFATDVEWSERMRRMLESFGTLAPYIYGTAAFENPLNKPAIVEEITRFEKIARNLHMKAASPKQSGDPSLPLVAGRLETDLADALSAFKADNREYARYKLKRLSRNCFQCHSQGSKGPEFGAFNLRINEANLKPMELAEIFVATRQFDRALESMQTIVESKSVAQEDRFAYQRAVRNYLAIAVRVKGDPKLAQGLVEKLRANPNAAEYLKDDAVHWGRSLDAWAMESKRGKQDKFQKALRLVTQARKLQEYPFDGGADVLYLRATALLHEYLETTHEKQKMSEAMYHLGRCYEVLSDIGQWFLQDTYYEACVRNTPKTEIAKRCFQRYEFSVFAGFSGSGGVFLPDNEREKLNELRTLALGAKN